MVSWKPNAERGSKAKQEEVTDSSNDGGSGKKTELTTGLAM